MKRVFSILLAAIFVLLLFSCGEAAPGESAEDNVPGGEDTAEKDVIDLTKMSSQVVYAYVYDMLTEPQNYLGKTFRIGGQYYASYFAPTDNYYHYCIIADATACCSQGMEFIWDGNKHEYPADYTEIVITGDFSVYEELGVTYYYIAADSLSVN
ncbi:MAG: hypothetical protein J5940_05000 [Clostridia bacterium]|nr:hypothetical protein [Clostridia bacterium]